MAIIIKRKDTLYEAHVTPPHGKQPFPWHTPAPLERSQLIKELVALGCHTTDIGDALDDADLAWERNQAQE